MSWFKLDDQFPSHPKVMRAGPEAMILFVAGGCYCARYLTDGMIPKEMVGSLTTLKRPIVAVRALVSAGLWVEHELDFEVHDYLDYNPSKEYVEREREWSKQRGALNRDPELTKMVRARDCDRCRYCGQKVNFKDRRSDAGGTYDHVIPRGPNTLDNVVVACRACNMHKGARTPDEAGLILLEPNQIASSSDLDQIQTPVPVPGVPSEHAEDARAPFEAEFEELWYFWPKKLDKAHALEQYQARRRAGRTQAELMRAVVEFTEHAQVIGTEVQYLPYLKTFIGAKGQWVEWLDGVPIDAMSNADLGARAWSPEPPSGPTLVPDPEQRRSYDDEREPCVLGECDGSGFVDVEGGARPCRCRNVKAATA